MRFLKANTLFNGEKKLADDAVLVLSDNDTLKEIISDDQVEKGNIEHLDGILMPGFVNAHCHLELSHLKGKIPQHTGLPDFAKQVITSRNKFSKEEISECMKAADAEMHKNGIVAVGDISNGSDSFAVKAESDIFYHTFIELIGLNPASQSLIFDKGLELLHELKQHKLRGSLAPHAPYSTSTALIKKISDYDTAHKLPFSIHNQESEEESKFLEGTHSAFHDLFGFLGLDLSWYQPPGISGLGLYAEFLSAGTPSLLVHNTLATKKDLDAAGKKNCYWCFCPAANQYIENRLPDFDLFADAADRICFGTDSLASNTQLNVLEEANILLKNTKRFSTETILRALTLNAATALGITDRFGSFVIGKNPGLNLVSFTNGQLQLIKKIS